MENFKKKEIREGEATAEAFYEIKKKMDNAVEDDTPYVIHDKVPKVVGDPHKTTVKKENYTVRFCLPRDKYDKPENARETKLYYVIDKEYHDIGIEPRNNFRIMGAIIDLIPFYNKLYEDGQMKEFSELEIFSIFAREKKEAHLAVYNIVATFLDIDDETGRYMEPMSVFRVLGEIIEAHPEIINESELFSESSTSGLAATEQQ